MILRQNRNKVIWGSRLTNVSDQRQVCGAPEPPPRDYPLSVNFISSSITCQSGLIHVKADVSVGYHGYLTVWTRMDIRGCST